jgi:hypothetical protein
MTRAACSRLATEIQHEIRSTPREVKFGVHVEVSKSGSLYDYLYTCTAEPPIMVGGKARVVYGVCGHGTT